MPTKKADYFEWPCVPRHRLFKLSSIMDHQLLAFQRLDAALNWTLNASEVYHSDRYRYYIMNELPENVLTE